MEKEGRMGGRSAIWMVGRIYMQCGDFALTIHPSAPANNIIVGKHSCEA